MHFEMQCLSAGGCVGLCWQQGTFIRMRADRHKTVMSHDSFFMFRNQAISCTFSTVACTVCTHVRTNFTPQFSLTSRQFYQKESGCLVSPPEHPRVIESYRFGRRRKRSAEYSFDGAVSTRKLESELVVASWYCTTVPLFACFQEILSLNTVVIPLKIIQCF